MRSEGSAIVSPAAFQARMSSIWPLSPAPSNSTETLLMPASASAAKIRFFLSGRLRSAGASDCVWVVSVMAVSPYVLWLRDWRATHDEDRAPRRCAVPVPKVRVRAPRLR